MTGRPMPPCSVPWGSPPSSHAQIQLGVHTHTHSLVKKQAMEVQQPDASTWEAVTTEFG